MFFCSRCCLGLLAATCRLGRFETLRDFPRNAVAHASSSTCGRSDRSSFSSVLCYYDHRLLPLGWKSRAIPQKHRSRSSILTELFRNGHLSFTNFSLFTVFTVVSYPFVLFVATFTIFHAGYFCSQSFYRIFVYRSIRFHPLVRLESRA